jgi:UDP-N-acetylmuramate-alanine ligase
MFFNEFVNTLSAADRSIIYPIYQAHDEEDYGVSSKILVDRINEKTEKFDSDFVDSFDEIVREIKVLEKEWIVILLGAGEIYQISDKLDFVEKI